VKVQIVRAFFSLPLALRAQLFTFELGITGGTAPRCPPVSGFLRSSGCSGEFNLVFTERSNAGSISPHIPGSAGKWRANHRPIGILIEAAKSIDISTSPRIFPDPGGVGPESTSGWFGLVFVVANR
jgi:hypothetical protein